MAAIIEIAQRMNSYIQATQGNAGLHLPKVTLTIDTTVFYVRNVAVEVDNFVLLTIWDTRTYSSYLSLHTESPIFHKLMKIVDIPSNLQTQVPQR